MPQAVSQCNRPSAEGAAGETEARNGAGTGNLAPLESLGIPNEAPLIELHTRSATRKCRDWRTQGLRLGLFGGFDGGFGALKADLAVGAVAEGLVDGATAAAEGECGLAGEVVRLA